MISYHPLDQAEVASRDVNIRQLEEKCEQLEAQVSPAVYNSPVSICR